MTNIPPREWRLLAAHVTGETKWITSLETPCSLKENDQQELDALIKRRQDGEPIAKILGYKHFWKDTFITNQYTLDPRPDSETVIELMCETLTDKDTPYHIIDLGTGTGCLLLSALREYPNATGVGIDISDDALTVAQQNAKALGLEARSSFLLSDWLNAYPKEKMNRPIQFQDGDSTSRAEKPECIGIHEDFETLKKEKSNSLKGNGSICLANPPYIGKGETLDTSTLYDPHLALFAEDNGLHAYQRIFKQALDYHILKLFVEIGAFQEDSVTDIALSLGWQLISKKKDLGGYTRALLFER